LNNCWWAQVRLCCGDTIHARCSSLLAGLNILAMIFAWTRSRAKSSNPARRRADGLIRRAGPLGTLLSKLHRHPSGGWDPAHPYFSCTKDWVPIRGTPCMAFRLCGRVPWDAKPPRRPSLGRRTLMIPSIVIPR
jgi:hypothetical protein